MKYPNHVYQLTKKQLKELRSDITLDSDFTRDYENGFGINPKEVQAFFDGFSEEIEYLGEEAGIEDYFDARDKFDNIEQLWRYHKYDYSPVAKENIQFEKAQAAKIKQVKMNNSKLTRMSRGI